MIEDEGESFRFIESDSSLLVRSVRETIYRYLTTRKIEIARDLIQDSRFERKMGCFVTLKLNNDEKSLRGCIGFPEPVFPLSKALTNAAIYAATQDPRFEPIRHSELGDILVEVSLLTSPQRINTANPDDLLRLVRIGIDGLVMKWAFGSGLLLPQVARESNWTTKDYLENLGIKAGAQIDQWLKPNTRIYRFQAQVFEEISPGGGVVLS